MSKRTKILSILLAVCFLLSVTAAAASAHADNDKMKFDKLVKSKKVVKDKSKPTLDKGKKAHFWNNKMWMWVWVPKHCEYKVIKTVKIVKVKQPAKYNKYSYKYNKHSYKYNKPSYKYKKVVIKKKVKICVPGHWELKFFKFNQNIFKNNQRRR